MSDDLNEKTLEEKLRDLKDDAFIKCAEEITHKATETSRYKKAIDDEMLRRNHSPERESKLKDTMNSMSDNQFNKLRGDVLSGADPFDLAG